MEHPNKGQSPEKKAKLEESSLKSGDEAGSIFDGGIQMWRVAKQSVEKS